MSFAYDMLLNLNEDNYEFNVDVDTLEELTEDMVRYFEEYDMFDNSIQFELDDFKDENGEIDEVKVMEEEKSKMNEYINSIIEWQGKGEYCVVGYQYDDPKIMKVDNLLECELDYAPFPIPLDLEIFNNTKNYILEWKKSEGYKHIYLISFVCHVGEPWYAATHIVYSNKKIDNVIKTLHEDRNIFIGEFDILGANYVVEEVEDFDIYDLLRYRFNDEYKVILMD